MKTVKLFFAALMMAVMCSNVSAQSAATKSAAATKTETLKVQEIGRAHV